MSSERERGRYAAVFQDQYTEFLELQQEVGSALAKLQQLETLLNSLPKPRSQVSPSRNSCPTALPGGGLWPLGHHLGPRSAPEVLTRWVTLSESQFPHPSLASAFSEQLPLPHFFTCRKKPKLPPVSGENLRRSRW